MAPTADPASAQTCYNRGLEQARRQDFQAALLEINQAIALPPDFAPGKSPPPLTPPAAQEYWHGQ